MALRERSRCQAPQGSGSPGSPAAHRAGWTPGVSRVVASSTAGCAGDLWLGCVGPFAGDGSIQALGQCRAWCQVGRGFLTQGHKSPSITATASKITPGLREVDRSWLAVDEFSPQTRCVAPSQVPPLEGAEKPLSRSSAGAFPGVQSPGCVLAGGTAHLGSSSAGLA